MQLILGKVATCAVRSTETIASSIANANLVWAQGISHLVVAQHVQSLLHL